MKKITFVVFMLLASFCGFAQLAQEGFETGWVLDATGTSTSGWFNFQNSVGPNVKWVQGAINSTVQQPAYEGERAAFLAKDNVTTGIPEDYLVTPQFNVPEAPELHFFSRLTTPGEQGGIYKVFIVDLTANPTADLNSPASYTELQSWTETQINPSQTDYLEKVVVIPDTYIGSDVRIAFMMAANNADRWLIDNVSVVKKCVDPLNLIVENIGLTSVDLSWENTSGATQWEVEVIEDGAIPTGVGTVINTMPYTFSGLVTDTCYKYYVRALCDGGGKSGWAGAYYFCTKRVGDDCTDPIVATTLPYSNSGNTIDFADIYEGFPGTGCGNSPWENYLSGNDVVYQYTATFTGAVNIDLSNNGPNSGIFVYNECADIGSACLAGGTAGQDGNPVSLDDFAVVTGEDYYIVISTYSDQTTPYTLVIQAVACDEPTNLSVSNVGMTSVDLSWDNPTNATSWGVVVQAQGGGVPQGAGTTVTDNSNFNWPGLTASTPYEFWVRADCGNGTFSAWAGPFNFNSMICDTAFQCEFTFTMWDMWDTWNGHTMSVKQNGITLATLTGPDSSGDPVDQVVKLCNNLPVQLYWNAGGSTWAAGEIGISVKNGFDQEIYVKNPGEGIQNSVLYEVVVDCESPYCLAPKALTATNPTLTTIDLAWEGPATGEWEYYIVPAGSPAPTDATTGILTTTNPTIGAGPLVASTNYDYYVRMHCENASTAVSPWSTAKAFSSSVCDPIEKCEYQFVLNASWDGWRGATMTVTQNGTNVAILGPTFEEGGTSQTVNVPLCTGIPFEIFWNEGGEWEGNVGLQVINNFDQTLFEVPIYSSGLVGTEIFAADVDCLHPACLPPTGLASANGTVNSIDLSWDGPATGDWEYIVLPAGSAAPSPTTPGTATTTNPTIAAPLAAPSTNYDFYVRVVCTGASEPTSSWAGPYAIHSEACNPEDKCMFHFELLSQNGWNFGNNTMTVYQAGVPAAVLGPGFDWTAPSQNSYMVDVPLCPGLEVEIVWNNEGWDQNDKALHVYSPYWEDVFVKDFGEGAQGETIFTGLVSCDPPACIKPIELSVSNVQLNSVDLSWNTQGSTATSWEVWVLPFGSPAPDPATTPGTVVTTNPYTVENLTSGTPYVYYVRANCAGDGYSTVSSPRIFVTAIENDNCDAAINVPVNAGLVCTESVPGTLTGATASAMQPSCSWSTVDYEVWFKFTATSTDHAIALNDATGVQAGYAVYTGDDCGNLTEVGCEMPAYPNDGAVGIVHGLTIGTTYYIQVYATYMPNPADPTSFSVCISTPAPISVDATMTVPDIVNNALVVETCANIQNITWSTGTDAGVNGIGYFEKSLSAFGIEKGVVLMTGDASKAPGPNIGQNLSGSYWQGDTQLFDYITGLNIDPGLYTYNDATVLEFDFTPLANKLRFPFIFASEEYGQYQCSFSDAFAFFLTELDADGNPVGEPTNLALVPGTNAPVSVVTIRNDDFNTIYDTCPSANEAYFANYYGPSENIQNPAAATDPMLAPINFNGVTVKMFAESDVIPNHTYHIKLVIADRNDSSMDSAVFIGAFDIGKPDLGEDLTIAAGSGLCNDASFTIASGLPAEDYTFQWYRKAAGDAAPVAIPNATAADYTVQSGGAWGGTAEYSVIASFGGVCTSTDAVVIEFYGPVEVVTGDPVNLIVCDADGFATFDLSDNTPLILEGVENPSTYTVSYHLTEDDAKNNVNELPLTGYDNVTQAMQQIYVRIVNEKGCVGIKTFALVVQDLTPFFTVNEDFSICEHTTGTITVTPTSPANYDPATVTYSWTLNGNPLTETTATITVEVEGDYEVTVNNQGCPATDGVTMTVIPTPVPDVLANVVECTQYTLPALSEFNYYYSATGGAGNPTYSAGDVITTSQTIFVVARNAASGDCFAERSFEVKIIPAPVVAVFEECRGNDYVLEVSFDGDEVYNQDNVTLEWTNEAGTTLGSGTSITITEAGKYYVTVTPSGQDKECPLVVESNIDNTTCLIPRGISPNGDKMNDEFDLTTLNVKKLEIFNRYGQEVYSKSNYTKEWIGQGSNGDELPTGTYYYMIERSNGETKTGWVYINRQEK